MSSPFSRSVIGMKIANASRTVVPAKAEIQSPSLLPLHSRGPAWNKKPWIPDQAGHDRGRRQHHEMARLQRQDAGLTPAVLPLPPDMRESLPRT